MKLSGKTVVITGGTDGLGLSLVKQFVNKGAKVVVIARNQGKIDSVVKEVGERVSGYVADVRNLKQLQEVAKQVGSVDVLINNAGVWLEGSVADNSEEEIAVTIDTNLKGVIFTTKAFLSSLERDEETHIVNISSTSGLKGRDNQAVYVASKFGVTGFTDSLKVDLASTNIKVTGFYPGGMSTQLFAKAGTPKENEDWMDTDKVAEIIVFMVERDASLIMDHVVLNKRKTKTSN